MAASFIPEDTETSMDDFICCSICFEIFTDPKILNCHHTFCVPCLRKLPAPQGRLSCPTCRQKTPLPSTGGTKALTTDFRVNQLIDNTKHKKLKHEKDLIQFHQKEERNCDFCKANAKVACLDCDLTFCSNCKEAHRSWEVNDGHSLIPFSADLLCNSHSDKLLVSFCYTCSHGLCKLCAFRFCKHHKHRKLSEYSKFKKELESQSSTLDSIIEALKVTQEEVTSMKETPEKFEALILQITETAKNRIQTMADKYLDKTKRLAAAHYNANPISALIKDYRILKGKTSQAVLQSPWDLIESFDDINKKLLTLNLKREEILSKQCEKEGEVNENEFISLRSAFKNDIEGVLTDMTQTINDDRTFTHPGDSSHHPRDQAEGPSLLEVPAFIWIVVIVIFITGILHSPKKD